MQHKLMKVCGMRDAENIVQVLKSKIDFMGFIFYDKSSRNVIDAHSSNIAKIDFGDTKKIGVFVDESLSNIKDKIDKFQLDGVQLHGDESPAFCESLDQRLLILKAISVRSDSDVQKASAYHKKVSYILFDTKSKKLKGGTGKKFNWNLLQNYKGPTPFLLSGGIQASDIEKVGLFEHPYYAGVDLNSGFEISPALKDEKLISGFKMAYSKNK